MNTLEEIKRGTFIKRRVSELYVGVVYKCQDRNCVASEEDEEGFFGYMLTVNYSGFELDHQSDSIPLNNKTDKTFMIERLVFFNNTSINLLNWEVIKYKEERGIAGLFDDIFDIQSEFISGFIQNAESYKIDKGLVVNTEFTELKVSRLLSMIVLQNEHNQYTEYKRIKVSVLDVVANIGALFTTVYAGFIFIFKYYSKNYDNYNIINKILSNKKKSKIINTNFQPKNDIELSNVLDQSPNNIKTEPLISDFEKNKDIAINDVNVDNVKQEDKPCKEQGLSTNLEQLSFSSFLLNDFNYCNKIKGKETLNICSDILAKYSSIEILLYNQMMFENLMKDYK